MVGVTGFEPATFWSRIRQIAPFYLVHIATEPLEIQMFSLFRISLAAAVTSIMENIIHRELIAMLSKVSQTKGSS